MTPRPYQQEVLDRTRSGWNQFRRQIIVLPTGSGKTCLFSWIAQAFQPERTLILAHREELVDQAIEKLHSATGIFAQKEKAEFQASLSAAVVVASVQTMRRRLDKWPSKHFRLVVCDEAHHVPADEWQLVLKHFDPHAFVLGCTATPDRADRRNLGRYFENIAAEVTLFDLINQGFLSRIHVRALPLKIDLKDVGTKAGDYDARDIGNALTPYLGAIAQALKIEAASRRVLAFLPLIASSQAFVRQCQAIGLRACHIDGTSPDRKEILERFANDEFDILSNAMLLTEGYDDPCIDCIVNLRPTRSRALYSQIVGRGTRIAPMKENLLLLDFLWQHEKHNLIRPAHLVAPSDDIAVEMTRLLEVGGEKQEALDLEDLAAAARESRERKLREELDAKAKRQAMSCDAMDFCLSVGNLAAAEWEDVMPWHAKPASDKQLALIAGAKIDVSSVKSRGHASAIIDLIQSRRKLGLASPLQVRLLRRMGHPSPETASKEDASAFVASRGRSIVKEVAA